MSVELDLADIQGNILTAYGRLGFPKGRFILLNVSKPSGGRAFVNWLLPRVTTALRWPSERSGFHIPAGKGAERPLAAVNIAFTFPGLCALQVPTRTLRGLPDEFIDGMIKRAPMLGDDALGPDWLDKWDPVWTAAQREAGMLVHMLVMLNAQMNPDGTSVDALETMTQTIRAWCTPENGVTILEGHRGAAPAYQDLSAIMTTLPDGTRQPLPKEHFGFTDGIGDPAFEGQVAQQDLDRRVIGNGKVDGQGRWLPLATGEFLLGYPDEAQEIPGAAMPLAFSRNGTFMSYRKLHENVFAFRSFMQKAAESFGATFGISDPFEAQETFMAKIAGRWPDGVPLSRAPDFKAWQEFNRTIPMPAVPTDVAQSLARDRALADFTYGDDRSGSKCPVTSHMRRVNTRDMLAPTPSDGSVLNNRRRILRRGLPYGDAPAGLQDDSSEHGIIMLNICSSLFRQFEFVQQQWINYGLDFNAGNDTCPLVGNHAGTAKFVIPADPASGHPPFIVEGLPQFVETRGGDYFFIPSMTALRMIGLGVIDPT